MSEKNRDKKFFSFGYGVVIDSLCDRYSKNSMVSFLATNHPEMVDVVTIHGDLVRFAHDSSLEIKKLKYFDLRRLEFVKKYNFDNLVGYSIYSGRCINPDIVSNIFKEISEEIYILKNLNIPDLIFDVNDREIITSKSNIVNSTSKSNNAYAILFGFGQYAKTIVIPNLAQISVKQINEVDPLQLPRKLKSKYSYSTAESFNNIDIEAQIVIIAGFHHTHAELVEKTLIRGMFAIVEKPLCVDINQFYKIKNIIESNPKKVFLCFHKRVPYI
ncbi:MAG: Gfo/Idh/MocA family oxidoreductase [Saprospiraceae bacterium]|nr:Gfo/Idh/MocA family oxidoreductase [Saprospiraceae bacterium]